MVRNGADFKHPKAAHTLEVVYSEMLLQICMDYPGLPDVRTMRLSEIRFFYNGERASLRKATK